MQEPGLRDFKLTDKDWEEIKKHMEWLNHNMSLPELLNAVQEEAFWGESFYVPIN